MILRGESSGLRIDTSTAKRIGGGGEGEIYEADDKRVVKVYKKAEPWTTRKLKCMLRHVPPNPTQGLNHLAYTWPVELLLNENGGCVGFVMPRLRGFAPLVDLYTAITRRTKAPEVTYKHLINIAVNLCSAFEALHANGYVVGDVNQTNVFVSPAALPTLIDTDSFQVRDPDDGTVFRCRVMKPDFTPRELLGENLRQVDRSPSADLFGLAVLVYHLLMEGAHPFAGKYLGTGMPPSTEENIRQGDFPHAARRKGKLAPKPGAPPFEILAPEVQRLFIRCFEDGHEDPLSRPTAQEWKNALMKVLRGLRACPSNPRHFYSSHLAGNCAWCERQKQLKGYDVFPAPGLLSAGTPPPPPTSNPATSTPTPPSAGASPVSSSPSPPSSHPSSSSRRGVQNVPASTAIPGLKPKRSMTEIVAWVMTGIVGIGGASYLLARPKTNVALGEACSKSMECAAPLLVCMDGKCALRSGHGGRCNYDESCQAPLVCSGNNTCLGVNVGEGGECSGDGECATGLVCKSAKCTKPLKKSGEACSNSGECEGKLQCMSGKCAELKKFGEACSSSEECFGSWRCVEGKCGVSAPAPSPSVSSVNLRKAGESCFSILNQQCEPGLSCLQYRCGVAQAKTNDRCNTGPGCVVRSEPDKFSTKLTTGGSKDPVCYLKPDVDVVIVERLNNGWRKIIRPGGCPSGIGYMSMDVLKESSVPTPLPKGDADPFQ